MRAADRAVVLHSIRHGDRKYVVKLYTREHGLVSAIVSAGKSATAKVRTSALLPLSLIDIQLSIRHTHELQRLTEASSYHVPRHISTAPGRLAIAQFINEVLIKCLREQQPNPGMYRLIEETILELDKPHSSANLHLHFMRELCALLGFEPNNNFGDYNLYFDCREGGFTPASLSFPLGLSAEDSRLFSAFLKTDILNTSMSRAQRQSILESLEAYYRLHVPGFNDLRSIGVLREVMD
jgi:DNA repair protein RecO (recombination protein O)